MKRLAKGHAGQCRQAGRGQRDGPGRRNGAAEAGGTRGVPGRPKAADTRTGEMAYPRECERVARRLRGLEGPGERTPGAARTNRTDPHEAAWESHPAEPVDTLSVGIRTAGDRGKTRRGERRDGESWGESSRWYSRRLKLCQPAGSGPARGGSPAPPNCSA